MTKRSPFGSHDPNVQRSGDSVASSVPSVEQALRLRRKKKKNKTLTLDSDGSFLIDTTSKTPRISNRTKQLPPRRGTTKQLRRLEQSMASRAKQERQQRTSLSEVSVNTNTNHDDTAAPKLTENKTVGTKRKEHAGDNVTLRKKLRKPVQDATVTVNGSDKNPGAKTKLDGKKVASSHEAYGSTDIDMKKQSRTASADSRRHQQEEVVANSKRLGRNVSAESLHKHHDSNKTTTRTDLLSTHQVSTKRRLERSEAPAQVEKSFELKRQVTQEAMMDCTSDDESLHLSPESSTDSPVRDTVVNDKERVFKPPAWERRQSRVEEEESEQEGDRYPRLSMTTHAEGRGETPLRTPTSLANESTDKLPHSMEDLIRRENAVPIVTKGMLSRARHSKADNEEVVDAMMKSGPPYKGRQERSPTPDASMVGTMIGVHSHERSNSVDGSEVTMLTNDSFLNEFSGKHSGKKQEPNSDNESQDTLLVDKKKEADRRASPDDVSAVPETVPHKRGRRSRSSQRMSSIREPDESVDEGNQVIYYEHNGVTIQHPPLPSGWIIRMSQSKQRPFYSHPDHGSTWHCPIVLPRSSSDSIFKSVYQPALVNETTTRQKETKQKEKMSNEDDTESEDSEMWSGNRQRNHGDAESVLERQSQTSAASLTSSGHLRETSPSVAKAEGTEVTGEQGSDLSSLASSVGDKAKHADSNEKGGDVKQRSSSLAEQKLVTVEDKLTSPEIPQNQHAFDAPGTPSQASMGSGTPRNVPESKASSKGETFGLDDSSPGQGVARVSLVTTEATTEELSPLVVEELVSTAHFRRQSIDVGTIAAVDKAPNSKSNEFYGRERDEAFLSLVRDSHSDTGSLAIVAQNGGKSGVDSPVVEAEIVMEESVRDDDDDFGVRTEPAENEKTEADAQSVDSKLGRGGDQLQKNPIEGQLASAPEPKDTIEHTVAHRAGIGRNDEDVAKHGDFEGEVDDIVFGVDHDDIDLSPQTKHLSPIKHMNSFDNDGEQLPTEPAKERKDGDALDTAVGSKSPGDDSPVGLLADNVDKDLDKSARSSPPAREDDSPVGLLDSFDNEDEPLETKNASESRDDGSAKTDTPAHVGASTKNNSPVGQDDSLDDRSAEPEEFEPSYQDQHDDQLSVESPFPGTTSSIGGSLSAKWRGYSYRILHPPHPLDSLMNLEALIEAALRRLERRKKAAKKKSSKTSKKKKRRATSTKLVFE